MSSISSTQHRNTVSPTSNRSRNSLQGKSLHARRPHSGAGGQVRIIGGQWRGRKLAVADVAGLRPTGNRIRETLFNWLQADMAGSRCLDLFAGSGALGFEALSRYAASVTFVEPDPLAFRTLQDSAIRLGLAEGEVASFSQRKASEFLAGCHQGFDIVFIDPPFSDSLQWQSVALLRPEHLSPHALVYVESPSAQVPPEQFPHELCVYREKVFGDVHARLLMRSGL